MAFLRAGALARLQWKWINRKEKLLVIPGTTPGLKHTKKIEGLQHHVPLTNEMNALLKQPKQMNGHLTLKVNALDTNHASHAANVRHNFQEMMTAS